MPDFQNKPNHIVTDKDGNNHWISRSLAVVVTVILNDEKVLLVKRGEGISSPGKWCNPCGYLDWNESATQCAIREVYEETGFDLTEIYTNEGISYGKDSKYKPEIELVFGCLSYPWDIVTNPELNYNQDIALYFGVSIKSDKCPELTSEKSEKGEISEAKWVDIKDITQYDFTFNHDKRINKFINYLNKNK